MENKTLSVVLAASNPITMDFPFVECIQSVLPIADEIVIVNGDDISKTGKSEVMDIIFNGFSQEYNSGKIKTLFLPWREAFRKNMELLAKSTAISQATKDYVLLLDCDEVIHEDDFDKIKECLNRNEDAYSFRTLHFYRDYNHYKQPLSKGYWYNHRPKLFKNGLGIWDGYQSWIDEDNKLHTEYTADLVTWDYKPVHSFALKTSISIYHYGYVRDEKFMLDKQNKIEKRYHPDYVYKDNWEWEMDDCLEFDGIHPKVMDGRITLHQCHYHDIYKTTICKDNHKQSCPDCDCLLQTITDHFGGGSHYWHLVCNKCKTEYYWDTYRMKLEYVKDKIEE